MPSLPDHLTPHAYVVSARHGDNTVLLNAVTGRYYSLNATGGAIWQWLCDGVSPEEIALRVQQRYGVAGAVATADVNALLVLCARAGFFEEPWSC